MSLRCDVSEALGDAIIQWEARCNIISHLTLLHFEAYDILAWVDRFIMINLLENSLKCPAFTQLPELFLHSGIFKVFFSSLSIGLCP